MELLTMERNRWRRAHVRLRGGIQAHIGWLEGQLREVEQEIGELLDASPAWQARAKLLQSVPGVGPVTCATLIAPVAGVGEVEPAGDRGAGGGGAVQPGQRDDAGPA